MSRSKVSTAQRRGRRARSALARILVLVGVVLTAPTLSGGSDLPDGLGPKPARGEPLSAAPSPTTPLPRAAHGKPNLLLLVAEDLSPRIGAFGDSQARTPNLDALAAQGVRFPNTFTTAGVCAPSRSALMLGMHAISTGTQHMRAESGGPISYRSVPPPEAKAFPELLRGAGYFTYQHAKLDYQFSGTLSGSGPSTIWDAEDNQGHWNDRSPGQPFFGMITDLVTHESGVFAPLGTNPRNLFHFIMQVVQTYQRWGWQDAVQPTDPAALRLPPYYPDLPEVRRDLARHYDNIQIMDARVGEILARLEKDGLADQTIVIWTTDHGDGLPRAKRDLFDSGLRVPMIIRWPDALRPKEFQPGQIDSRLISFIDLSATIVQLGGLEAPSHFQGQDFLDPRNEPREFVFASRDRIDSDMDRQRAVRDAQWKYIWSAYPERPSSEGSEFRENLRMMRAMRRAYEAGQLNAAQRAWFEAPGEERLFDLATDPHEVTNLAQNPAYAETLERMRRALAQWQARVPDWSDVPEAEMIERFWPGGEQPETAPPTFQVTTPQATTPQVTSPALGPTHRVEIQSATPGASIAYRADDERWKLYTAPLVLPKDRAIEARAVRYGYAESKDVRLERP